MLIGGWKLCQANGLNHALSFNICVNLHLYPYSNKGRMGLTFIHNEGQGRAMSNYMGEYYWTRTSYDLAVLRSKKILRTNKLRGMPMTYLNQQEIRKLTSQISDIDAVLAARKDQTDMFIDL